MTRKEMIEALEQIKEAIANSEELNKAARFYAYISVEDAIEQIRDNYDGD